MEQVVQRPDVGRESARTNWEELRRSTIILFSVAVPAVSIVWCLVALKLPRLDVFAGVGMLLLGAALSYWLRDRHPGAAAVVLTACTFAGIVLLAALAGLQPAITFLVLPVIMAGVLFHPLAAVAAGLLGALAAYLLRDQGSGWVARAMLLGCAGGGTFLAFYTGRTALNWAWWRSEQASDLAELLRDRQGMLSRTMKTLELTNHLLQRTNRELELARRDTEEARRLKAEFAANISHELRTPLNIILGFTEVMSRSPEVYGTVNWSPLLRRDVAEIRRNARYLSEFVDDILDLARVDALRMPIHREPSDLAGVVEEAAGVVRRLLQDKRVRLVLDPPSRLPSISLDRTRIRQVMLNLLTNAVRFSDEGTIGVSVRLQPHEVVVAVSDTGRGIPQEELGQIFDEFHQAGAWRQPEERGKGLGLAVARQLVQLHGGRIWAESKVNAGSTFYFSLPLEPKEVTRLKPPPAVPLPTQRSLPVVVVLDEGDLAATYLQRHLDGYSILAAESAAEARELVRAWHPRAVIVNLPPDGEVRTEELKALALPPGVPVLACCLPSRRWLVQDERFAAALTKPVSAEQLMETVRLLAPEGDVLVVDDERGFVHFVQRAFQAAGQDRRLRWAFDGAEALSLIRERPPALVLLDVVLPGMDGMALADAIRADRSLAGVKLVVVTGANLGEDALAIRGDTILLTKPRRFRADELLGLLGSALALASPDYVTVPGSAAALQEAEAGIPAS